MAFSMMSRLSKDAAKSIAGAFLASSARAAAILSARAATREPGDLPPVTGHARALGRGVLA